MEWFAAGCSWTPRDLSGRRTDKLQQEKEDLDNVHVEGECSEHILLRTDGVLPVPYQQLCVVCQEQSEGYGSKSCINHVKPRNIFEGQHNGCNDASHEDDDPQDAEESLALSEVNLCLEAEDRHGDADNSSDRHSEKHRFCVVVTGYGSSQVRQSQSKDEQQNYVPWELPPWAFTANQHKVGDDIHGI